MPAIAVRTNPVSVIGDLVEAAGGTDAARPTCGSARSRATNPKSWTSARQSRRTLAALRWSYWTREERKTVKVRKLGPTENELHVSVANLLDWVLKPPAFWTTFPAGWGKFSGAMAQLLKRMGLKAGMPDILVFYAGECFGIELKTGKNTLTPEQRATHAKLEAAGVLVTVCRSVEDVMIILANSRVPLRNFKVAGDKLWPPNLKSEQHVEIYARHGGIAAGDADGTG